MIQILHGKQWHRPNSAKYGNIPKVVLQLASKDKTEGPGLPLLTGVYLPCIYHIL